MRAASRPSMVPLHHFPDNSDRRAFVPASPVREGFFQFRVVSRSRRVCRLDRDGQREIMVEAARRARAFRAGWQTV